MSGQVTDAELTVLEYSQVDLQELLGDALLEAQHIKELQAIGTKDVILLQDKARCAAAQADFVFTDLTQTSSQTAKELQRELASKCCELSAAQLDLHHWKGKAALQQLRLVSAQEDLSHQKVHTDALSAECSRRQAQCNALQNDLRTAHEDSRIQAAQQAAANADLQDKHRGLQAELQGKESLLCETQSKLQQVQGKLAAAEQAAAQAAHTAERQHAAVEERARLAEQVAAAVRERADLAEQRLARRAELAQERQQHAADLSQERQMAAAQKAAVTEQGLRSEIVSLQEALQTANAARLRNTDAATEDLFRQLQATQTELLDVQRQVAQRDVRIASLEEVCRHRDSSATPAKLAEEAMETVSALVADLDVTDAAQDRLPRHDMPSLAQAARTDAAATRPGATKAQPHKAAAGQKTTAPGKGNSPVAAVYTRQGKPATAEAQTSAQVQSGRIIKPAKQAAADSKTAAGHAGPKVQEDDTKPAPKRKAVATAKAKDGTSAAEPFDGLSPNSGRPLRQRGKAQPYWMGTAAGNSPLVKQAQQQQASADAVMTSDGANMSAVNPAAEAAARAGHAGSQVQAAPQHDTPAVQEQAATAADGGGDGGGGDARAGGAAGRGKKAAVAKRQAAGLPQKEQQPAKKSRAGSKAAGSEPVVEQPKETQVGKQADKQAARGQNDSLEGAIPEAEAATRKASAAAAAAKDPIAGAMQRFGLKQPTRPVGVSKIDLASSFTDASSPATAPSVAASAADANKENEGVRLAGKANPALHKVMPNPPAALNPRVVSAATSRRGPEASEAVSNGPDPSASKVTSQPAVATKRKILKPVNANYLNKGKHQDVLPANMLFGDAFMVPKLRK